MDVFYTPRFLRMYRKLEPALKEEVREKIELFKNKDQHKQLKVHKLKGTFRNTYGFSVNYQVRVLFEYLSDEKVAFLVVGDHDVYKT